MVKGWKTTADIKVPKLIVEQVIGQDSSVELIRKAAKQKRNVLLVGLPGTGKSLLAQAMAEILPVSNLMDVLVCENQIDPNTPKIQVVKTGEGKKIIEKERFDFKKAGDNARLMGFVMPFLWFMLAYVIWQFGYISDIIFAALLILGGFLMVGFIIGAQVRPQTGYIPPKILVENSGKKNAPFFDATGARAGALLGDVRHDPLQSFIAEDKFVIKEKGKFVSTTFGKLWKRLSNKYPELIEKHKDGYKAIVFPKNEEIYTYGYKDKKVVLSKILSMNKRDYSDKIVNLKINNSNLIVTPEHKIITSREDKEAEKISKDDELFVLSK